MNLSNTQLFQGLQEQEITLLLDCLNAVKRSYKKGETIIYEGNITENIGIVLSGMVIISCNDIWGNNSVLGNVSTGSVFAEAYACIPGQAMLVTVSAIEDTITKSIRDRLMSYFSQCAKYYGNNSFLIPYNRQQLADYLNVDRSSMCNELSKMQKDGLIDYKKNHFILKT